MVVMEKGNQAISKVHFETYRKGQVHFPYIIHITTWHDSARNETCLGIWFSHLLVNTVQLLFNHNLSPVAPRVAFYSPGG